MAIFAAPFVIAFMQTEYTALEGEGSVEVCVNLASPDKDILDENLRAYVTNDEYSIYTPIAARLASELLLKR